MLEPFTHRLFLETNKYGEGGRGKEGKEHYYLGGTF
jgi:hypothetical protein